MTSTSISRLINAPRAKVYAALIDPNAIAVWRVPTGMTARVQTFEGRVGGKFRVSLTYDEPTAVGKTTTQTDTYHGHFVELVPNERIVERIEFESANPDLLGEMTITTVLTDADGGTELRAVHDGLPPGLSAAANEEGWRQSLAKLAAFLEGAPVKR